MLEGVHNHACDNERDRVVPFSCACCTKCWLYVAGNKVGRCPYNGPFSGYVSEEPGLTLPVDHVRFSLI